MKKVFVLFSMIAFMVMTVAPASAQANLNGVNDKVTVNLSDLTPEQRLKIEAQQKLEVANAQIEELQKKIDTYGKWVGVGGEIGTAVKEGLTAVVDVADKFGKTDVGHFTMVMIAWKVVGRDVVKIVLGLFFFIVLTLVIIKVYRRVVIARSVLVENPGFLKYPKKYEVVKSELDSEGTVWMTVILLLVFLIGIWITYSIMF
jgi:hypothetical protein